MLKKIILDGQIPYFEQIKRLLFWIAIVSPFAVFLSLDEFDSFGELGWMMLTAVMLVRPLSDILPRLKILRTLVMLRREFGIFAAFLIIAHFVGYAVTENIFPELILDGKYWDFSEPFAWGLLGIAFSLFVLITSNKFSILLLKKRWKIVQRLSYIFFLCGGIHISLMGEGSGIVSVIVVAIAWALARFGFKLMNRD